MWVVDIDRGVVAAINQARLTEFAAAAAPVAAPRVPTAPS